MLKICCGAYSRTNEAWVRVALLTTDRPFAGPRAGDGTMIDQVAATLFLSPDRSGADRVDLRLYDRTGRTQAGMGVSADGRRWLEPQAVIERTQQAL